MLITFKCGWWRCRKECQEEESDKFIYSRHLCSGCGTWNDVRVTASGEVEVVMLPDNPSPSIRKSE